MVDENKEKVYYWIVIDDDKTVLRNIDTELRNEGEKNIFCLEPTGREKIESPWTNKLSFKIPLPAGNDGDDGDEAIVLPDYDYEVISYTFKSDNTKREETTLYKLLKEVSDEAQEKLDMVESRDAEWHYVQAIVYFKRNWHVESKKQLELALTLDPNNEKYKRSYTKLTNMLNGAGAGNAGANAGQQQGDPYAQQRGGYARPQQGDPGMDNTTTCCNTCSTLICCDCCCEMMGGDLIPCC